ncbi:MAG: hypothetical protein ACJAYU_003664 [Bradymonadia bacterium]|jgi:hypothetical protein
MFFGGFGALLLFLFVGGITLAMLFRRMFPRRATGRPRRTNPACGGVRRSVGPPGFRRRCWALGLASPGGELAARVHLSYELRACFA